MEECWANRIHQCLFCDPPPRPTNSPPLEHHKFEYKSLPSPSSSAGILCLTPTDLEYTLTSALTTLRFVPTLTLYTSNSLPPSSLQDPRFAALARRGVILDHRPLLHLEALDIPSSPSERIKLHFPSSPPAVHSFLLHKPRTTLSHHGAPLALQLGLKLTPGGRD
ncbi:hypothetical protein BCR35DRAFT_89584 [Leucosporidium creatinivorum]|uniref:Uncharacterized protein n=1 Tax=Leucosporidium creatinivorum TaxID=106004 RepID=A0A1Y2F9W0_9BASI|nr:hypothetical protein BCR35DRAFT_89584 [Leucosporidium creatinivorum]